MTGTRCQAAERYPSGSRCRRVAPAVSARRRPRREWPIRAHRLADRGSRAKTSGSAGSPHDRPARPASRSGRHRARHRRRRNGPDGGPGRLHWHSPAEWPVPGRGGQAAGSPAMMRARRATGPGPLARATRRQPADRQRAREVPFRLSCRATSRYGLVGPLITDNGPQPWRPGIKRPADAG